MKICLSFHTGIDLMLVSYKSTRCNLYICMYVCVYIYIDRYIDIYIYIYIYRYIKANLDLFERQCDW